MNKSEVITKLSEPFEPSEIEWRIGSTTADKTRGAALAYLTARAVMNRLDEVVGVENWQDKYTPAPSSGGKAGWICELSLRLGDEWITKSDGADEPDIEPIKGGISDALKRAAVKWGIGRYLYNLDAIWVEIEPVGKSYRLKSRPTLPAWALPKGAVNQSPKPEPEPTPATPTMTVEEAVQVQNSEGVPYGNLSTDKLMAMTIAIRKALKAEHPDDEREVYQRKLEAINVILKARQSGELAQSNNAN